MLAALQLATCSFSHGRKRAGTSSCTCLCTRILHKMQVRFQSLDCKMDLPFQNRLAHNRVHTEKRPPLSWAPPGAGLPFVQPPSLHDIAGPLCFAGDIVCAAGELNRLQLRRRVERPHCTRRYSCATTPSPAVETPPIAVGNVVVLEEVSALFMQHIWTIVKHDGPHHLELSGLINPLQPDRTDRTRLGGR